MKKLAVLIAIILSAAISEAQVAIINDKDGYTNVREQPNTQAEVIHRINSNEVFWYSDEEQGEWIKIYVPKNDFSFGSTQTDFVEGFIHKSRLLPLEKTKAYKGSNFTFKYEIKPFSTQGRIIDKQEGRHIVAIDGRPVWGTDGNYPKTQVIGVDVRVEGKQIPISRAFYNDIYECSNSFNVYKNGDTYFVYQWNSDGAGGYQIVWVFTKEGLKQRLVGSMI